MSSESDSRVRQFGLYKTIDSKTAEFLKLSRKRQIRRGCACAAVSTAITVTVVVGAFLVYEFAFHGDFKSVPKATRHSSWFNTVTDPTSFDKNTPMKNSGKLLAVILKALDQKRYLGALVDEYSTYKTSLGRTSTYPYKKDVFTAANSLKATRFRPPPFPKNRGKENIDKVKKIADYQRVMTYLNSMSFIKNTDEMPIDTSSHRPSRREDKYRIEKFRKSDQVSKAEKRVKIESSKHNRTLEQKPCCTCPPRSNLSEILGKLYNSIQQLGPRVIKKEQVVEKGNNKNMATTVKIVQHSSTSKDYQKMTKSVKTEKYNSPSENNKDMATTVKIVEHSSTSKDHQKMTTSVKTEKYNSPSENNKDMAMTVKIVQHSSTSKDHQKITTSVKTEKYNSPSENNKDMATTVKIVQHSSTSKDHQKIITSVKTEKYNYPSENNKDMATTVKIQHTEFPFNTTAMNTQETKPTTTIKTKLETTTNTFRTVFTLRSDDTDRSKGSKVEQIETTVNPNVYMSHKTKHIYEPPRNENIVAWKHDFTDVVYDDTTNIDDQTESNDGTFRYGIKENRSLNNLSAQYDFDDKSVNLVSEYVASNSPAFLKKDTSVDTDLVNFLSNLNRLQTLVLNTPQTPPLNVSVDDHRVKQWNFENYFTDEIDPLNKHLAHPTERVQTQKPNEELYENSFGNNEEKPVIFKTKSCCLLTEDNENIEPVTTLEYVTNKPKAKLPLPPMIKSFLLSRKENGLLLNFHETTTAESSEDLSFNVKFDEDDGSFSSSKKNVRGTVTPVKEAQHLDMNINERTKPYMVIPIRQQHHDLKTDDVIKTVNPTNTRATITEAQKQDTIKSTVDSNLDRIPTKETQQDDDKKNKTVSSLKTNKINSTSNAHQYNLNVDKNGNSNVEVTPKKLAKVISRIRSLEPASIEPLKMTETRTNHQTAKPNEIFYMTGNDNVPIDDFEATLHAIMDFDSGPVNYTALANSFLNKDDSGSIENVKSMLPQNRPSHLEIRRNNELFDNWNWHSSDEEI